MLLKLLNLGIAEGQKPFLQMLALNKIFFIPIVNPDGCALIEQEYLKSGKIVTKRKNMSPLHIDRCGDVDSGIDLNRNWQVDWASQDDSEKCHEYWPGNSQFTEPETRAVRDFISLNK